MINVAANMPYLSFINKEYMIFYGYFRSFEQNVIINSIAVNGN